MHRLRFELVLVSPFAMAPTYCECKLNFTSSSCALNTGRG
ncbi:hypothetical protein CKAH01_11422 [Colletotrichum kahawae]|uniref:Uncharacterized protein n=1 Tax=Colletotrichum kahawae TaxID=34407 RepID=A0AAE0DE74_COLKA|nr:hypothetical protein CKAH01_11422 [Colletotrichum kahawae]